MRNFLLRLPRWAIVTGVALSAGVVLVVPTVSKSLTGWPLVITLSGGAIFASLTIVLNHLQQWQQQQASMLNLTIKSNSERLELHPYIDTHGVIPSQIETERVICMEPLNQATKKKEQASLRKKSSKDGRRHETPTTGQIMDIEARLEAGEETTEKEREQVKEARESLRRALEGVRAQVNIAGAMHLLGEPDDRSEAEYRTEIEHYLGSYENFLNRLLLRNYVKQGLGRLEITVVNKTDRIFTDVLVELNSRQEVNALDPDDIDEAKVEAPERPRPFGARRSVLDKSGCGGLLDRNTLFMRHQQPMPKLGGPSINNSEFLNITFHPITVRPHSEENLDALVLVAYEPDGTGLQLDWEVTATNAEGRLRGDITIAVSELPLPVADLLRNSP